MRELDLSKDKELVKTIAKTLKINSEDITAVDIETENDYDSEDCDAFYEIDVFTKQNGKNYTRIVADDYEDNFIDVVDIQVA